MSQKPVITIEDITNTALKDRRPGCEKGMLHAVAAAAVLGRRSMTKSVGQPQNCQWGNFMILGYSK